jgi:hypothetical protein
MIGAEYRVDCPGTERFCSGRRIPPGCVIAHEREHFVDAGISFEQFSGGRRADVRQPGIGERRPEKG